MNLKMDEQSYEALRQSDCLVCGTPVCAKCDPKNRVYVGGSGHMDDISEEIDTIEREQLYCDHCQRVVAERSREVHIDRSYYSMRQDVVYSDWQYSTRCD